METTGGVKVTTGTYADESSEERSGKKTGKLWKPELFVKGTSCSQAVPWVAGEVIGHEVGKGVNTSEESLRQ